MERQKLNQDPDLRTEFNAYDMIAFDALIRRYGPETLKRYCDNPPNLRRDIPRAVDQRRLQERLNDEAVLRAINGTPREKLTFVEDTPCNSSEPAGPSSPTASPASATPDAVVVLTRVALDRQQLHDMTE